MPQVIELVCSSIIAQTSIAGTVLFLAFNSHIPESEFHGCFPSTVILLNPNFTDASPSTVILLNSNLTDTAPG